MIHMQCYYTPYNWFQSPLSHSLHPPAGILQKLRHHRRIDTRRSAHPLLSRHTLLLLSLPLLLLHPLLS